MLSLELWNKRIRFLNFSSFISSSLCALQKGIAFKNRISNEYPTFCRSKITRTHLKDDPHWEHFYLFEIDTSVIFSDVPISFFNTSDFWGWKYIFHYQKIHLEEEIQQKISLLILNMTIRGPSRKKLLLFVL